MLLQGIPKHSRKSFSSLRKEWPEPDDWLDICLWRSFVSASPPSVEAWVWKTFWRYFSFCFFFSLSFSASAILNGKLAMSASREDTEESKDNYILIVVSIWDVSQRAKEQTYTSGLWNVYVQGMYCLLNNYYELDHCVMTKKSCWDFLGEKYLRQRLSKGEEDQAFSKK